MIEPEELYVVFVNLRRAYENGPHMAVWRVLKKYDFPQ